MIYFDNAATSFPKPPSVIRSLSRCVKYYCGNPGRSAHPLSIKSAEKIYETRLGVARLFGIDNEEYVSFTKNATEALNIAIKCTVKEKSHCIISDLEHNSVIRPLEKIKRERGVEYSVFDSDLPLKEAIIPLIREDTGCIICSVVSNVTGKRIDITELSRIAREKNLTLILDASQAAGHININLSDVPCNILCAPSHKGLFGIQGAGILLLADGIQRDTLTEGGSGSDSFLTEMPQYLPDRYEAGTLPTPAIVSLGAGIDYIQSIGLEEIYGKIKGLTEYARDVLLSVKGVKLYGADEGIISFNFKGLSSSLCAEYLVKKGIYTRAGYHCSPLIHRKIKTEGVGAVRVSFSYFNKKSEIDRLYFAMKELSC